MRDKHCFLLVVLFCSAIGSPSQVNERKAPEVPDKSATGSNVTGHVYLDDTKAPARKAHVYLQPAVSIEADGPPNRTGHQEQGPVTASVDSRFDGSYSFTHVAPGSYYVIATFPGYISPFLELLLAGNRFPTQEWAPLGAEQRLAKNRVLRSLPRVDVQSNLPVSIDVVLERGGAVSGNISYDDGGPAVGVQVLALTQMDKRGNKSWTQVDFRSALDGFMDGFSTDDRGNYRISGLPPGGYAIEADVEFSETKRYISSSGSNSSNSNAHSARLPIYSGSTPRKKDAAGFTLQAREERNGEDIVIPMSKLHTIKGNIVSAGDGHVLNGGGVLLMDADDHSFVGQQALTEDDPSFTFSLVFEGEYILTTMLSADVDYVPNPRGSGSLGPPQFDPHVRHFYGSATMALHVDGDMEGIAIRVPEPSAKEAEIYGKALREEERRRSNTAAEPQ